MVNPVKFVDLETLQTLTGAEWLFARLGTRKTKFQLSQLGDLFFKRTDSLPLESLPVNFYPLYVPFEWIIDLPYPPGCVEMNGQTLDDPDSELHGTMIQDRNNSGRIAIGSTSSVGQSIGNRTISLTRDNLPTDEYELSTDEITAGTPTGNVSLTAVSAGKPTGNVSIAEISAGTPSGSITVQSVSAGKPTGSVSITSASAGTPSGTVSTNSAGDHTHTISDPGHTHTVGVPSGQSTNLLAGLLSVLGMSSSATTSKTSSSSTTGIGVNTAGAHTHGASFTGQQLAAHTHGSSLTMDDLTAHGHSASFSGSQLTAHTHTASLTLNNLSEHNHSANFTGTKLTAHSHQLTLQLNEGDQLPVDITPLGLTTRWLIRVK